MEEGEEGRRCCCGREDSFGRCGELEKVEGEVVGREGESEGEGFERPVRRGEGRVPRRGRGGGEGADEGVVGTGSREGVGEVPGGRSGGGRGDGGESGAEERGEGGEDRKAGLREGLAQSQKGEGNEHTEGERSALAALVYPPCPTASPALRTLSTPSSASTTFPPTPLSSKLPFRSS